MKRIFIFMASVVLMTTGCSKMLNLYPSSAVSPDAVGVDDISALRNGMYWKVQEEPGERAYIMFDLFGGELTTKQSKNSLDLINSLSSANNEYIQEQWAGFYKALMQVNNVYVIAGNLPEGNDKNTVLGECHYFRAYLHLCLVTRWGDVPLMAENSDALVSRTPKEEVWKFIETELDASMRLLGSSSSNYYLSKDAAVALRARVALYRGDKVKAAELAESLISNARYTFDDYEKIFRGQPNTEVIFAFPCLTADGSAITISTLFYSYNHPNAGSYVYVPAQEVMEMYAENDKRRDISVMTLDNLNSINKYPSGQTGTDPVIISRISELYLISAEAQGVEKGLPRLNQLRQARGLNPIYPGTEAEFIDALLKERRLELLCEGHRWYDLVRHGKAVATLGILDYQTLLPIPTSERQANGNLSQNDGY